MNTLRDICSIVLPLTILAAFLVVVFYAGLVKGWWK